jgi:uncharacterized protein YeaC (DUF1315 family)
MNEQTVAAMLAALNPEVVANLRTAVELGKWPNGERLSREQRETCMQAVLAWEVKHLPEHQRTGYIDRGSKQEGETCGDDDHGHHKEADEQLLKIIQ